MSSMAALEFGHYERIAGRRVAMGAGEHGMSAFVDADALVSAFGATLADISD